MAFEIFKIKLSYYHTTSYRQLHTVLYFTDGIGANRLEDYVMCIKEK